MSNEGYLAYLSSLFRVNKKLYRIRIGNYANKTQATEAQLKLKQRYLQNKIVQNSIIVKKENTLNYQSRNNIERYGYSIQFIATVRKELAQDIVSMLHKHGYSAYIIKYYSNNKLLYRVRLGNYSNKETASVLLNNMKRKFRNSNFIKRAIIVKSN